ncbi:hypothetical protein [Cohnella cellulosilytica]
MDFGLIDPHGRINGLLGLDILLKLNAIVDLKKFALLLDDIDQGTA